MPSLADIIKAQREQAQGGTHGQPVQQPAPAPAQPAARVGGLSFLQPKPAVPAAVAPAAPLVAAVDSPAAPALPTLSNVAAPEVKPASPAVRVNLGGMGLRGPVGGGAAPVVARPAPSPKPAPQVLTPKPAPKPMTMDDALAQLADMDVSHVPVNNGFVVPASRAPQYKLPDDYIPIPRVLPAELTEGQQKFVEQLDGIRTVFHDSELFSQIVRGIMQDMQANPEFESIMSDEDVSYLIRGMRDAMGAAKAVAATKKRSTATGSTRAKKPTALKGGVAEVADLAAELGFTFGDD